MSAKNLFASVQLVVGSACCSLLPHCWPGRRSSTSAVKFPAPAEETTRRAHRQPSQRWVPS